MSTTILTTTTTTTTSPLTTLPAELLTQITHPLLTPHPTAEPLGNFPSNNETLTTPLNNLLPPPLSRTSQDLRSLHLPVFFAHQVFRVYVDMTSHHLFDPETIFAPAKATINPNTKDWLDGLNPTFRHIQFRLLNLGHHGMSANFNITFSPARRAYTGQFVVDEGWPRDKELDLMGNTFDTLLMGRMVWNIFKEICGEVRGECLDWTMVKRLKGEFDVQDCVKRWDQGRWGRIDEVVGGDWSEEIFLPGVDGEKKRKVEEMKE